MTGKSPIKKLVVLHQCSPDITDFDADIISLFELSEWVKRGIFFRRLFYYRDTTLYTHDLNTVVHPFAVALLLWLLTRGNSRILDRNNHQKRITLLSLSRFFLCFLRDLIATPWLIRSVRQQLHKLDKEPVPKNLSNTGHPLYIRSDLWLGVKAGGSITHISGVINNLHPAPPMPILFTSDHIPLVNAGITQRVILPTPRFQDYPELPELFYNRTLVLEVKAYLKQNDVSFIYQRYSLNNFTGASLAGICMLPFVLEYNGSEVWMSNNWGRPLTHKSIAMDIEYANLRVADLIVVVSEAMGDELINRGIPSEKILVNPNGVDTERFNPGLASPALQARLNLDGKTVIGFIGTFGPWHGTDILLKSYLSLLNNHPEFVDTTHLLMIGEGEMLEKLQTIASTSSFASHITFTGLVPQVEGPDYLALCDILVAPTLANQDGSVFFGSPTKLFEYMAMGKGIIASDVGQIGDILHHEKSALLVPPGECQLLCKALSRLIAEKPLRQALGEQARTDACQLHTWERHTRLILSALENRFNVTESTQ